LNNTNLPSKYDIRCPHFEECSGCTLDANVNHPELLDDVHAFFGVSDIPIHIGDVKNWRCRAKMPVRGTTQNPTIGLYRKGTHQVTPIPDCRIHHPAINKAIEFVREWIISEHIAPYDEVHGRGVLRYIQCVVERSTQKVQLTLVLNASTAETVAWTNKTRSLWKQQRPFWHSIWLNFNLRRDNVIFGHDWHRSHGDEFLWEKLNGVDVCFQPASFAQANLDQFEKILETIKDRIPSNAKVAELYAGVGVIGLSLADKCDSIVCSDVNASGSRCFESARKRLQSDVAAKISWIVGDASKDASLLDNADTVIVDPPRAGLHRLLLETFESSPSITDLIYVSCGWPSFKRDYQILLSQGWGMDHIELHLLFPGSNHIETVAFFKRRAK